MSFRHHATPVSIIVAVDSGGGFGKDGKIPWNIPEDMKHFREKTKGGVCIMGRRTYEDMLRMWKERNAPKKTKSKKKSKKKDVQVVEKEPNKILVGRESFVVTSDPDFHCPGATAVGSITQAIQSCPADDTREIFVIGGYRMFVEALSRCQAIYMTIIKGDSYGCNKNFPIEVLNKYYQIVDGTETDKCYFVTYVPKPIRRRR